MSAKETSFITVDFVFYTLVLFAKFCGANAVNFRITNYHMCVSSDTILYTFIQISIKTCVEKCAALSDCSGVTYKRHNLCQLHSIFSENIVGNAFFEGQCVFVNKADIFVGKPEGDCDNCDTEENCNMKYCPSKFCPPLKLGNGTLLGNMNSVGSRVEYSCNPYFAETVGETNPTCQVNRSWTHYPKCTINFKYLGCYEDRSDRILYGRSMHSSSLTTETCLTFCFESGFKFASTQYGSHCFCGNVLRDYPEKAESECNKPCAGDPTEMCGGTWRGSIYKGI